MAVIVKNVVCTGPAGGKSFAVKSLPMSCCPGKISTTAARPLRYAGSEIASASASRCGTVVGAYIEWLSTSKPGVPFGMCRFATSTSAGGLIGRALR
jgi:hypothetical protein